MYAKQQVYTEQQKKKDDGHSDDFSLRGPFREKNLLIPAAAGSPLLVFWPLASACGAVEVLPRCAQLVLCELYAIKDLQKKIK